MITTITNRICLVAFLAFFSNNLLAYNFIDENGLRQGYWIIYGNMSEEKGYEADQKVEEGNYVDNKREGLWKKFFPNGKLKSEITYQNNHPRGPYKLYYDNGVLEEASTWIDSRNHGDFKRYFSNGQLAQEFFFNENGRRDGNQKYFFENGNLRMAVEISNGIENGSLTRFYPNGEIREKMVFIEGKPDPKSIQRFKPTQTLLAEKTEPVEKPNDVSIVESKEADKPNLSRFNENGYNTLYNKDLAITQVGEFKNGKLWNGKWHRYDSNGILKKIEVYREGKYIGNGIIEDKP